MITQEEFTAIVEEARRWVDELPNVLNEEEAAALTTKAIDVILANERERIGDD